MRSVNRTNRFDPRRVRAHVTLTLLGAGLLSLAIAIGVFIAALCFFPSIERLPGAPGSNNSPGVWGLLEGIASLATFCLVIGGLVFASIEYHRSAIHDSRESALSSFNIYKEMYDKLTCPQATEARRWIMENLRTLEQMDGDHAQWLAYNQNQLDQCPPGGCPGRPPGREYLKQVLNTFDFIGYVDKQYWTMEDDLVEWINPPIAKIWARISGVVEDEAARRSEPDFYRAARDLGSRCLEWREANDLGSNYIDHAT